MHPSAILLVWLFAVISTPWLDYPGIALLAVIVALLPGRFSAWWAQVRRARWVLLTLWGVFSMGVPGEPLAGLLWAPTYEGIAEANRHVLRLVLMLGFLSALFAALGREGLVSGLRGVMPGEGRIGEACDRLVVRLALVLENAYRPEMLGAWKRMLHGEAAPLASEHVHLHMAAWRWRDGVILIASMAILWGAAVW